MTAIEDGRPRVAGRLSLLDRFLAEVFLGEVAHNVAHFAPVPVLLIPHPR